MKTVLVCAALAALSGLTVGAVSSWVYAPKPHGAPKVQVADRETAAEAKKRCAKEQRFRTDSMAQQVCPLYQKTKPRPALL